MPAVFTASDLADVVVLTLVALGALETEVTPTGARDGDPELEPPAQ